MELKIFDSSLHISSYLRKKVQQKNLPQISTRYIAYENDRDVAFVILDEPQKKDYLCIYELFVNPKMRRKGMGTKIIKAVEEIAREKNYPKIYLRPCPLEKNIRRSDLIHWYSKMGYQWNENGPNLMEKIVKVSVCTSPTNGS